MKTALYCFSQYLSTVPDRKLSNWTYSNISQNLGVNNKLLLCQNKSEYTLCAENAFTWWVWKKHTQYTVLYLCVLLRDVCDIRGRLENVMLQILLLQELHWNTAGNVKAPPGNDLEADPSATITPLLSSSLSPLSSIEISFSLSLDILIFFFYVSAIILIIYLIKFLISLQQLHKLRWIAKSFHNIKCQLVLHFSTPLSTVLTFC